PSKPQVVNRIGRIIGMTDNINGWILLYCSDYHVGISFPAKSLFDIGMNSGQHYIDPLHESGRQINSSVFVKYVAFYPFQYFYIRIWRLKPFKEGAVKPS